MSLLVQICSVRFDQPLRHELCSSCCSSSCCRNPSCLKCHLSLNSWQSMCGDKKSNKPHWDTGDTHSAAYLSHGGMFGVLIPPDASKLHSGSHLGIMQFTNSAGSTLVQLASSECNVGCMHCIKNLETHFCLHLGNHQLHIKSLKSRFRHLHSKQPALASCQRSIAKAAQSRQLHRVKSCLTCPSRATLDLREALSDAKARAATKLGGSGSCPNELNSLGIRPLLLACWPAGAAVVLV
jgi:hypothetical protein